MSAMLQSRSFKRSLFLLLQGKEKRDPRNEVVLQWNYIKELLVPLNCARTLRSSTKNLLKVPKSRTKTYSDRAFSVIGPVLWNKLPDELRHELSLNSFKSKLKTFLFRHFYE